jgi:DNA-binding LacI/PurR family transcriptional regulator/DNA-binding transcriptional regulator YhcF (GntR family)
MPKSNSQTEKAGLFLRTCFSERMWNAGERLPSVRDLAAQAGVSFFSMWKALKDLECQNVVVIRKNQGVYAEHPHVFHSYIGRLSAETSLPEHLIWRFLCVLLEKGLIRSSDFEGIAVNMAHAVSVYNDITVVEGFSRPKVRQILDELMTKGALVPRSARRLAEACRDAGIIGTVKTRHEVSRPVEPAQPSYRWERLQQIIEQAILQGRYMQGTLMPALSELRYRYGVCFATLKKALRAVEQRGYLTAYKKTYRINVLSHVSVPSKIMLIIHSPSPGRYLITPRVEEVLRVLEKECPRRNVGLEIAGYALQNNSLVFMDKNRKAWRSLPSTGGNMIGYIVIENIGMGKPLAAELLRLKTADRPVAVIDEAGEMRHFSSFEAPFKTFFIATGPVPGRDVGTLLVSLGHRRVAFISPYHVHEWSVNRLKGLSEIIAAAGYPDGVRPCVQYLESRWHFGPAVKLEWLDRMEDYLQAMLRKYRRTSEWIHDEIQRRFVSPASQESANIREHVGIRPLIDSALKDSTTTALVCVNDGVGVAALEYLREKGIGVPREMSVIGFDDAQESFTAGLSSYNFNFSEAAMQALAYVLNPKDPNVAGKTAVECKGFVVERESTARARKKARESAALPER